MKDKVKEIGNFVCLVSPPIPPPKRGLLDKALTWLINKLGI